MNFKEAVEGMRKLAAPMAIRNAYDRQVAGASRQLDRGMRQMRAQLPQDPRFRQAMRMKNQATQAPTITQRQQQRRDINRQLHPELYNRQGQISAVVDPARMDQIAVAQQYPKPSPAPAPVLPRGVLSQQQYVARGGRPEAYQRYYNAAMRSRQGNTMVAGK